MENKQQSLERQLEELEVRLEREEHKNEKMKKRLTKLQQELRKSEQQLHAVLYSCSWKMTRPFRALGRGFQKVMFAILPTRMLYKGVRSLKKNGFRYTFNAIRMKYGQYKRNIERKRPLSEKEKERQRNTVFQADITFSILVPLYNTPELFLCQMIESVQAQTYSKWELCLADGSDESHKYVQKIVSSYATNDNRIKYQKLQENRGISENTNCCIEMATGDYIGLFDHDDLLHPAALFECMRVIEEKQADFIYTDEDTFSETPADAYCPNFKPDYSPDTLRSYNYICHFTVFRRSLLAGTGGFRKEFDGSQDYDLILRLTEQAKCIEHIPKVLYFWRAHQGSVASDISAKPYTLKAARHALEEHLKRLHLEGQVSDGTIPSTYRIQYKIQGEPLVSILIPNKDHIDDLEKCIDSIMEQSTYTNIEIIVIENNSTDQATFDYYQSVVKEYPSVRVITWEKGFNYAAINNFAVEHAKGDYLLLLNNDIEIITPDWIEQMLMFAQRDDVGIVGCKLYYEDDTVQHGGVIIGLGGVAGHAHKDFERNAPGYMYRLQIVQNFSAVTAACMMVSRNIYQQVGGMDEGYQVAFNDVDFCLQVRKAGYLVVFTPYAELYHYESKSRGVEDTPEKQQRFIGEVMRFQERWKDILKTGDPYYNPNLTLNSEDFSLR